MILGVLGRPSEGADLRRDRFNGERLEVDRLVIQAVAFGVPQRVLHPLLVVAAVRVGGGVAVVIDRVGAAAFLARCGRHDGGLGRLDQVLDFERLDARGVEDLGLVLQGDVLHPLGNLGDLGHAFIEHGLGAEHAGMLLHRGAQVVGDVLRVLAAGAAVQAREAGQRAVGRIGRQGLVRALAEVGRHQVVAGSTAEDQQVQQRVRAQAVGAMHADAGAFAHRVEPVDNFVRVAVLRRDHLTVDVGRDATHLVVDGRHHGDRFLGDVDVGEVVTNLEHRRQALGDGVGAQVGHVEVDVVLVGTAAATFLDFLIHAARHEVARREVLQRRRVALHEALAIGVAQDGAFAAAAFGQQHAGVMHAGRVELPELHVFQRDAGARRHAQAVTGVDEGIGGSREDAPRAAGGQQHGLALQDMQIAGFHFQRSHTDHVAVGVADQVQRHPLDEELRAGLDVLLVERVQHRVAGAVGRGAGALHRLLAVVGGVAAEGALVDGAVGIAVEGHAEVFEFVHDLGRFAAHELDRVLVTQPVGALDGVVEVVVPVVLAHVAERGTDAALGGHGVRAGREDLGQHGHVEAGARQLQRGAHAGATGPDDDHVELAGRNFCRHHSLHSTWMAQPAQPSNHTIENTCRASRRATGFT
mmetsp:Transcript_21674/g.84431  ORF Transcript_21674/g.84431 Transcript_21674/m.84431 type:complete len:640 (+) Transcript_21674:4098-6017(+)